MTQVIGFDLGSRKCGWCAGSGDAVPRAGGFRLTEITQDNIGDLGAEFLAKIAAIDDAFPQSTHWVYERPIKKPTDHLFTLERLYGLAFALATYGRQRGKIVYPVDNGDAKLQLAGRNASKDDMVHMALHLGVELPAQKVDGREDAADAVGVWAVGIRLFARDKLERIDRAIYSKRGGLL